jgi:hypothetical protein
MIIVILNVVIETPGGQFSKSRSDASAKAASYVLGAARRAE